MTDIATRWDVASGFGDWSTSTAQQVLWTDEHGASILDEKGQPIGAVFTPGEGLALGDDLLTALLISLFTDAQADESDVSGDADPRGWWGGPIGSKLWLRVRSRAVPVTLTLARDDIEQALRWLIEDDVVASVDVTTEWARPEMLGARVVLRRHDGTRRALAFARLWETI